jgi:hypothetical protein
MPSSTVTRFTPVAAQYLRNLDELEAAREVFHGELAKVLDELGAVMLEAATARQQVAEGRRVDKDGGYDVEVRGKYVALRAKGGDKRTSGYTAAIGSYMGPVGGHTLLWFHLMLTPPKRKRLELDELAKKLELPASSIFGEERWLYIRIAHQPAAELDLAALADQARRLPELFEIADEWIAQRYKE